MGDMGKMSEFDEINETDNTGKKTEEELNDREPETEIKSNENTVGQNADEADQEEKNGQDKTEEAPESSEKPAAEEIKDDGVGQNGKHSLKSELKTLKDEKIKLEAAYADINDRYLRVLAEYDNYRRRTVKEREIAYTDGCSDTLLEILPVIDNLERALTFADSENTGDNKLIEGVVMTLNQFKEALQRMGAESFGEKGEQFNPEIHNAVMHEQDDTKGENEITEVFQKGYRRNDKIIRHAMVKVAN